jgi:hypothetical protein
VVSFAAAGQNSVAALATTSGSTEVRHYSTSTGQYGSVITADPAAGSSYQVLGATTNRVLLKHRSATGGITVETWNTATDTLVGTTPLGTNTFVAGRVDAVHGQGAVLLHGSGNADLVLPVDLATGSAGNPIPADPPNVSPGTYSLLDFDTSTGALYLAKAAGPFNCLGSAVVARVDLATRAVAAVGNTSGCSHGIASDGAGTLYNLSATQISVNITPTAVLGALDETTGTAGNPSSVRLGIPSALAVDGRHKVAVVSYPTPAGQPYFGGMFVPDNNATGQLLVVDLTTGKVLRTISGIGTKSGPVTLQLDPATRTGWTYGPYNAQIQQFSY